MKGINAYLIFDGKCREAMELYAKALGAELMLMTYGDMPATAKEGACAPPAEAKNLVMHAMLRKGDAILMASDSVPGMPVQVGNNFQVNIDCESVSESEKLFATLSAGGSVTMPLAETFWAERFAMFSDRFGTKWMLNVSKPQPQQAHASH